MTEDMLDDLYDCLLLLSNFKDFDEFSDDESITLDKAYNIIKHLCDKYI